MNDSSVMGLEFLHRLCELDDLFDQVEEKAYEVEKNVGEV